MKSKIDRLLDKVVGSTEGSSVTLMARLKDLYRQPAGCNGSLLHGSPYAGVLVVMESTEIATVGKIHRADGEGVPSISQR